MTYRASVLLPVCLTLALGSAARAEDATFSLSLKDHRFAPAELTIPANQRVRLVVKNLDATPAEFESKSFKAEKVVPAGREVSLTIGPLKPGTYEFFDEYHEAETKGRLIVK
jgi:plastocyanin